MWARDNSDDVSSQLFNDQVSKHTSRAYIRSFVCRCRLYSSEYNIAHFIPQHTHTHTERPKIGKCHTLVKRRHKIPNFILFSGAAVAVAALVDVIVVACSIRSFVSNRTNTPRRKINECATRRWRIKIYTLFVCVYMCMESSSSSSLIVIQYFIYNTTTSIYRYYLFTYIHWSNGASIVGITMYTYWHDETE